MNIYDEPEQHAMHLVARHPDGADEFYCETCGRRMLIHWPPEYKKTVLEPGDEYAIHTGSKGGLSLGSQQMTKPVESEDAYPADDFLSLIKEEDDQFHQASEEENQDEPDDPKEAERLAQWDAWLDQAGFNTWWERDF